MLLTEHLVRCETGGIDVFTPWYKSCIERLQQIFLQHHQIIQQYMVTLENLLFTAELDHHILAVFQQFCALQAWGVFVGRVAESCLQDYSELIFF